MASDNPAYLYVISDGSGAHKVGLSVAPRRRLGQLQTGSPRRLTLVRTSEKPFHNPDDVEAYAHWLLRKAQTLGEWFEVTEDAAWVALIAAAEAVARGESAPFRIGGVGRKRINEEQMPARLPAGTFARMDAVLDQGERRSDLLRGAVERELKRREKRQLGKRAAEGEQP